MPITDTATFSRLVLERDTPVLVDFSSDWCPPCRALEKALVELGPEFPGVTVEHVDADRALELTTRYNVRGLPTLLAFHRGQVTAMQVGFQGKAHLRGFLAKTAEGSRAPGLVAK